MDLLIFAVIILVLLGFLFFRKKKKAHAHPYQAELLKKCSGDKEKVKRLIHFELNRHPRISKEKAAKFALESLSRDN